MVIQLKVTGPRGEEKILDVCENQEQLDKMTVRHLKLRILQEFFIAEDIRMVFRAVSLEEDAKLASYDIKHLSNIHALLKLPGGL